jgi:PAS domain S-box-containing protein
MATVLVVDDHPANRDLVVTLLRYRGHTLLEAGNGAQALKIARAQHPDLIITDLVMPVMDGYELVRELRSDPGLAETRVIFYTANYLREEAEPIAAALGVYDTVSKPATPERILAVTDDALRAMAPPPLPIPAADLYKEHTRILSTKLAGKVDELEAAEKSLKESEALFRSLAESSPIGIFALDGKGQVTYGNPRLREICGWAERLASACAWTDVLSREASDRFIAGLAVAEGGAPYRDRVRIGRSPGALRWAEIRAVLVEADSSRRTYVGTVEDVTEATEAQARTQRAEARFRGLLEAAPDAMVCVDADGQIVLVNTQAERLFGYRREDLAGQPITMLVHDAAATGQPTLQAVEMSGRRHDGTVFRAEMSVSAVDGDDGMVFTAAIRDVTGQRAQLHARDELERANRELESFASSLAHELRTPLRSLAGFSLALTEECGDALGESGRSYAEQIELASKHIGHILDGLLHLSEVARTQISLQEIDLGAEVASIARDLQRQDPGRRVRFTVQQPAWVLGDHALIRMVLTDLLANAWKFTSDRDRASIEFGTRPAAEARVCCYVRDDGVGFDPVHVHELFLPFQRLHKTGEFAGTGAGLASVRKIVERHGGRVWAQGTVGRGATFSFTLRAVPPGGPSGPELAGLGLATCPTPVRSVRIAATADGRQGRRRLVAAAR